MGKLLGHQIKNHFKYNWFIPLLPIIFMLSGLALGRVNVNYGGVAFGLAGLAVVFGYMAAAITIIVGDYNMFFGDSALFYESTPISPSAKTFSRVLYYFIMILIYSLFAGIFLFSLLAINVDTTAGEITSFWQEISQGLNQLGIKNIFMLVSWVVLGILNSIVSVIFAVTLGGGKKFGRFGFGGPVIVYIIMGFIESAIVYVLGLLNLFSEVELRMTDGTVFMRGFGITGLVLMIIEIPLLLFAVYYMHKNRISVN